MKVELHKLRFEGSGKSLLGRCSCEGGDMIAFIPGLESGTYRQQIKRQHQKHVIAVYNAALLREGIKP